MCIYVRMYIDILYVCTYGPTSVNISEKPLPQDVVLLLGVTVEGAECGKLLLGEVRVFHGRQALTEPGHADGSRSEGVKVFKVFRHLYVGIHTYVCVIVKWEGLEGGITQTDVQLPHTV